MQFTVMSNLHFLELNLSSCMALTRALGSSDEKPEVGSCHLHLIDFWSRFGSRAQRLLCNEKRSFGPDPRQRS